MVGGGGDATISSVVDEFAYHDAVLVRFYVLLGELTRRALSSIKRPFGYLTH